MSARFSGWEKKRLLDIEAALRQDRKLERRLRTWRAGPCWSVWCSVRATVVLAAVLVLVSVGAFVAAGEVPQGGLVLAGALAAAGAVCSVHRTAALRGLRRHRRT
ncbi:hypothetical protein GCM10020229_09810 [Kitasatospora albolonga]|uniref:DUF3040 domain-containing protein n=1 Tax=Kitasatospora albolonga TaxID=68173 RepID=UPI0031EAB661